MSTANDIYAALRTADQAIRTAAEKTIALEAERVQWMARALACEGGVVIPPVPPDPPIIVPPGTYVPDFSEFAFAHLIPAWKPHVKPTEADCDWIIDGAGRYADSKRGLARLWWEDKAGIAGACLKESLAAGHGPRVTFGVYGNGGGAWLGGLYDSSGGWADEDVCYRQTNGQWANLDVQFVGLSDDAEIDLTWGGEFGFTERLAAFDIGLCGGRYDKNTGAPVVSTHGIVANNSCGEIIIDGFWMLYPKGAEDGTWSAGIHAANWQRLVLRGLKRRGRKPSDPGVLYQGHAFYLKGSGKSGSETWLLENDLRGGNRTGFQRRPGTDEPYLSHPMDTLIVADNFCDSHGYDHESEDGGAAFNQWATGGPTFIVRNRARNCRYMALLSSAQPPYTDPQGVTWDRNWYDAEGYALGDIYVDGNDLGNVGSPRHCVSLNHSRRVFYGDGNRIEGKLAFGQASYYDAAPQSQSVKLVGDFAKFPTPYTMNPATGADERMTSTQMAALHVPTWAEALQ
jgi:hypothetical protein